MAAGARRLAEKLSAGGKVADVGCGHGASTISMAEAFPKSDFVGIDFHKPSIDHARDSANGQGNLRFEVARAQDFEGAGFDLVTVFDALHDMIRSAPRPMSAKRSSPTAR